MHRRALLATLASLGTASIAGCSGDDGGTEPVETTRTSTTEPPPSTTTRTTTTTTTAPSSTTTTTEATTTEPTTTTTAETTTEPTTETTTEPTTEPTTTRTTTEQGAPDIAIEDAELVVDEGQYLTDVYVAATVTNRGGGRSGQITLTVDWFDADDSYLGDSLQSARTLGAGEAWAARIEHLGSDGEAVEDFDLSGEFETEPPEPPAGATLADSELLAGPDDAKIRGQVDLSTDVRYCEAIGVFYDADGIVLGTNYVNELDLPGGETWRFTIDWFGDRAGQIDDHAVLLGT